MASFMKATTISEVEGWVTIKGAHFELNGSPFLFNGFNSYWLMHVASEPNERHKVTEVLRDASAAGLSVCRTWAFSDGNRYNGLQISPGVYDERVFQGLDFVLSEARKYGVRLILSFVNNWNDFGGKAQYVQWARNAGAPVNNDDDFFTQSVPKDYYKNHIKKIITRNNTITGIAYKDDPTVMAWELMNEPRCQADYSGNTVNAWVQEIASFVKSIDSKHLLEIGMEGFYGDSVPDRKQFNPGYQVGTDFISNHLIPEIDFATIHVYANQWVPGKSEDVQMEFVEKWITSHWQDANTVLKKPLVLAEFGKSSRDGGFTVSVRDSFMATVYGQIYNLAKNGGVMAGTMVWQIMAQDMGGWDDGYSIVLPENPSTATVLSSQSHAMADLSHSLAQQRLPRVDGWITRNGDRFELNGSPFLFNGFNSYWLMHVASDADQRDKVTEVLKEASAAGLSVCRTWAFSDGTQYNALQTSPGVYDERVFQGLDFVISEARTYGIHLILSFVNNWHDFGGKTQYANWARDSGVQVDSEDDFYTHPVLIGYYKNHIKKVITRVNTITGISYKDDPIIMAWELMNEPRCQKGYSGKTVNGWVEEIASYVKSLDNRHLLEIGMEGFYGDLEPDREKFNPGYQVGTDFISNHLVPEIDFATIHAYTDQWVSGESDDAQMEFMENWMRSHWEDAKTVLKKPLVLSEFGKSSRDGGFSIAVRDSFLTTVYKNTYDLAKAGGTMAGSMVWQLMAHDMGAWDDGYSIVLPENSSTAGVISGQSQAMKNLARDLPHYED
nr:mannan endo-1,4-beta-mannosidase 5 [Ipomoea batatas]